MPAYHVSRSIKIEKSPADVIEFLSDFQTWPRWSPWLIMEPDCDVTYQGQQGSVGAGYHWVGNMIGEGKMELTRKTQDELVMSLTFIKPFKSVATAAFQIKSTGTQSDVTWTLEAKLPFFLFFLKGMLEQTLGMDYERGLKMLKSLMETGTVESEMELVGERALEELHYVALEGKGTTQTLGDLISSDYQKIYQYFQEKGFSSQGAPFTLYFDSDMKSGVFNVRNCFPVSGRVDVQKPFVCDRVSAGKSFVVKHKGAYPFVGNGWALAMFAARHLKVKLKKSPVGFEWYLNDPQEVEPKDLVTEIVLLAK